MNTASIKEYYTNLQKLYTNVVNLLNGINKSLTTNTSDIQVSLVNLNNDDTKTIINIPSFLYLESRIEELSNNFNNLVNLSDSGDAWITTNIGTMHKINVAKFNDAPVAPNILTDNIIGTFKSNNFLTELLSPLTTLRLNLSDIPNNIHNFIVKRLIIQDQNIYNQLNSSTYSSYSDIITFLYNISKDTNVNISDLYKEYETKIQAPYNYSKYTSSFKIQDIVTRPNNKPNPYYLNETDNKLTYDIILDTIEYHASNETYKTYTLTEGDYITLVDDYGVYEIMNITTESTVDNEYIYKVTIREFLGHVLLQSIDDNAKMEFKLYNNAYDDLKSQKYIDIPLDNHQYVILCIASEYNNCISEYSAPVFIDLGSINMTNYKDGSLYTINDQSISYLDFFNTYCKNYGDLLNGLANLLPPNIYNFNNDQLNGLQNDEALISVINQTFNENILSVVRINDHIYKSIENNISSLNTLLNQKSELLSSIKQNNIDILAKREELSSTNIANYNSQADELNLLLEDRNQNYIELGKCTEAISTIYSTTKNAYDQDKFRIRGILDTRLFEDFIKNNYAKNIEIIGLDVEYKYVSGNDNVDNILNINDGVFSNWNKMTSIDRNKVIVDLDTNIMSIKYDTNSNLENIIKWNQIDIPINHNEKVIVRLRYKYNLGYPYMSIYSPWSSEITMEIPEALSIDTNILLEAEKNELENVKAKVASQLINEGYSEHNNDNVYYNNKKYFHKADTIFFSGIEGLNQNSLSDIIVSFFNKISDIEESIQELKDNPKVTINKYHDKEIVNTLSNYADYAAL